MKITGVTLDAVGAPLRVETLDLAAPKEGEVLVRMRAAGVCHSDQHVVTGAHGAELPCVLGHEGAGDVVAVGSGVSFVQPGDRVAFNWLPSCKTCFYCRRGKHRLCREVIGPLWEGFMLDGTSRLSRDGELIYHYSGVSTWADHMVVAQQCCTVINPAVPYEVAALVGCAVSTGVGAALHRGQVSHSDRVVVVGAGGVGLSVIMGAAMAGARRIIAVDREPAAGAMAMSLGATDFVVADHTAIDQVHEMTGGLAADIVFEAVGNPNLQQAWIQGVRRGGTLVLVGIGDTAATASFNGAELTRMEKTIKGSYFAATDAEGAIIDLCDAYLEGRLPVDRLISKRVGIDRVHDAVEAMLTGTEGRAVITFD